jgi:hypothetical protein
MPGSRVPDADILNRLMHPPYWLVYAMDWPNDESDSPMAEAAFAFAPHSVTKQMQKHVRDVVGFTTVYAHEHPGQRVIWFTDVTRWLTEQEQSWSTLGVDWERALAEIPTLPVLGLMMTVNRRAYQHLVTAAAKATVHYLDGSSEVLTDHERKAVHRAFEEKLDADWPPYIGRMLADGKLRMD